MGEGLYTCAEHGEQTPDIRTEAALGAARWELTCPVCDGPLKMQRTPERVSNPQNPYGMSKYAEEMVALNLGKRYGLPTAALRYSIVQGPRQSVYNAYSGACRIFNLHYLLGGAPTLYEDGQAIRDYVNIHDVVDANVLVLDGRPSRRARLQRGWGHPVHDAGIRRRRPSALRIRPAGADHRRIPVRGHPAHLLRHRRSQATGVGAAPDAEGLGRRVRGVAARNARAGRCARRGGREDAGPRGRAEGRRMKAFLLAAGLGTRLRPITDTTPKCLVEVGGLPMLDIWLDALAAAGVDEVLVNTHHLAGLVQTHVAMRSGPPEVRLFHEPELLGSAGTLAVNREFVAGEEAFLAVNADNLTDVDLRMLLDAHAASGAVATVTVFRAPEPSACGIVEVVDGRMTGFVEKPAHPSSDLANAGLYVFHPALLDEIPEPLPRDIGFDLLPRLIGRAAVVPLGDAFFADIGTPAALQHARDVWKSRATA